MTDFSLFFRLTLSVLAIFLVSGTSSGYERVKLTKLDIEDTASRTSIVVHFSDLPTRIKPHYFDNGEKVEILCQPAVRNAGVVRSYKLKNSNNLKGLLLAESLADGIFITLYLHKNRIFSHRTDLKKKTIVIDIDNPSPAMKSTEPEKITSSAISSAHQSGKTAPKESDRGNIKGDTGKTETGNPVKANQTSKPKTETNDSPTTTTGPGPSSNILVAKAQNTKPSVMEITENKAIGWRVTKYSLLFAGIGSIGFAGYAKFKAQKSFKEYRQAPPNTSLESITKEETQKWDRYFLIGAASGGSILLIDTIVALLAPAPSTTVKISVHPDHAEPNAPKFSVSVDASRKNLGFFLHGSF